MSERPVFLSTHLRFSWRSADDVGRSCEADDYLRTRRFAIESPQCAAVLARAQSGCTRDELIAYAQNTLGLERRLADDLVEKLLAANLLIDETVHSQATDSVTWWEALGWGPALYYHATARSAQVIERDETKPDEKRYAALRRYMRSDRPSAFRDTAVHSRVVLPEPAALPARPLREVLLSRRTIRGSKDKSMSAAELSALLGHPTARTRRNRLLSEGASMNSPVGIIDRFAPFELCVYAHDVGDVPRGIYRYDLRQQNLVTLRTGDFVGDIERIAIGQHAARASLVIFINCVFQRHMWRYRQPRAFRALMVNCARLAQLIIVTATTMRFRTFLTPALRDGAANDLLGTVPYDEDCLYLLAIG